MAEADAVPAMKTRRAELQDALNRFVVHPLSRRLALALRHTPVSPNMVSIASGLSIVTAAAAYTLVDYPASVAAGLFLHLLWHILDGADGDLARLTGKTSPLGEVIDGAADYLGHVVLYTALAVWAGGWCWVVTPLAAASRIVQATHIESVRRTYAWRAYGTPWLAKAQPEPDATPGPRGLIARLFAPVARGYVAMSALLIPRRDHADALIEEMTADPASADRARRTARLVGRRALAYQQLLGPNGRTLLLAGSMAVGSPLWFFLWEVTVLNVVLVLSVVRQNRVNQLLAAALARA